MYTFYKNFSTLFLFTNYLLLKEDFFIRILLGVAGNHLRLPAIQCWRVCMCVCARAICCICVCQNIYSSIFPFVSRLSTNFFLPFCFYFPARGERKGEEEGKEQRRNLCTRLFMILGFRNPFHRVYFVFAIFCLPLLLHSFFSFSQLHLV